MPNIRTIMKFFAMLVMLGFVYLCACSYLCTSMVVSTPHFADRSVRDFANTIRNSYEESNKFCVEMNSSGECRRQNIEVLERLMSCPELSTSCKAAVSASLESFATSVAALEDHVAAVYVASRKCNNFANYLDAYDVAGNISLSAAIPDLKGRKGYRNLLHSCTVADANVDESLFEVTAALVGETDAWLKIPALCVSHADFPTPDGRLSGQVHECGEHKAEHKVKDKGNVESKGEL